MTVAEDQRPVALILHPSDELYGADRVLLSVLEAISADVRPIVVLPDDGEPGALSVALRARNVQVLRRPMPILRRRYRSAAGVPAFLGRALFGTAGLVVLGRQTRAAVVHTNTVAILAGPLVAAMLGRPHVWHVHEIIDRPRWLGRAVARATTICTRRTVAISQAVADRLIADGGCVTDVLHNPAPSEPDVHEPFPLAPVVLMAGRVNGWKGHDVFVDAAIALRGRYAGVAFRLVGGPVPGRREPYDRLQARVHDLDPTGSWLQFAGHSDDMPREIAGATMVVLPSVGPEPLNITALEAMAQGRPVIASRCGGLPEVVNADETGILVPPGDPTALAEAIARLLDAPALGVRMGELGRFRARTEFSRWQYGADWQAIYRDLLRVAR